MMARYLARRRFDGTATPFGEFSTRMPSAFESFYGRVMKLDRKLELPQETAALVRERVAGINHCRCSTDIATGRLDAVRTYASSPLFTEAERAALDFATELAWGKRVEPETSELLRRYYSEREICDLVWLIASEHLFNMTDIGLDIGTGGLRALPDTLEPADAA